MNAYSCLHFHSLPSHMWSLATITSELSVLLPFLLLIHHAATRVILQVCITGATSDLQLFNSNPCLYDKSRFFHLPYKAIYDLALLTSWAYVLLCPAATTPFPSGHLSSFVRGMLSSVSLLLAQPSLTLPLLYKMSSSNLQFRSTANVYDLFNVCLTLPYLKPGSPQDAGALIPKVNSFSPVFQDFVLLIFFLLYFFPLLLNNKKHAYFLSKTNQWAEGVQLRVRTCANMCGPRFNLQHQQTNKYHPPKTNQSTNSPSASSPLPSALLLLYPGPVVCTHFPVFCLLLQVLQPGFRFHLLTPLQSLRVMYFLLLNLMSSLQSVAYLSSEFTWILHLGQRL